MDMFEYKNLRQFLNDNSIIIPSFQRDYAQGRDNDEAAKVRELFVTSIIDFLESDNNEFLSLDFTYGYKREIDSGNNRGCYYPLDGQQRITTLFLIHIYVYKQLKERLVLRELMLHDKYFLSFGYEERDGANEYIKALLEDNDAVSVPEAWHSYPSAEGMARTYRLIANKFRSIKSADFRKIKDRLDNIYFLCKDFGPEDTPEEIFCKMNSRGRQLTESEIFKSGIIGLDKKASDLFSRSFKTFYEKIFMEEYCDDSLDDSIKRTESIVMKIVRSFFSFIEKSNGKGHNRKITMEGFVPFSSYKKLLDEEKKYLDVLINFFKYWHCLGNSNDIISYILPKRIGTRDFKRLSQDYIASIVLAFAEGKIEIEELSKWMRIISNIIDNTDDTIERAKLLCSLSTNVKDIERYLSEKDFKKINNQQLQLQLKEECEKAKYLATSYRNEIIDMENFSFADGSIRYLFTDGNGDYDWDNFKSKSCNFKNLFDIDDTGRIKNNDRLNDAIRTYIYNGNIYDNFFYERNIFGNKQEGKIDHCYFWRKLFLDSGYLEFTDNLLLGKEKDPKSSEDDSIQVFIHRKSIAEFAEYEQAEKCRFHWNYCSPFLYPKGESVWNWFLIDGKYYADSRLYMNNHLLVATLKELYDEDDLKLVNHLKIAEGSNPKISNGILVGYRGFEYFFEYQDYIFAFVTPYTDVYNEIYLLDVDKSSQAKRPYVCLCDIPDKQMRFTAETIANVQKNYWLGSEDEIDLTVNLSEEDKSFDKIYMKVKDKAGKIAGLIKKYCENNQKD